MGPDEYHEAYRDADEQGLRNNTYTNVMVVWVPSPGRRWTYAAGGGPTPRRRRATSTRRTASDACWPPTTCPATSCTGTSSGASAAASSSSPTLPAYPVPGVRIGIVLDNYAPHLSTCDDPRVGHWAAANNVELASTPTGVSWLNHLEAQFTALCYFILDGTDHSSHAE
jgi:hypothetical protein